MKVLLDENLPIKLKLQLSEYESLTVRDMKCHTISWSNGADFAPEYLYELKKKKKYYKSYR